MRKSEQSSPEQPLQETRPMMKTVLAGALGATIVMTLAVSADDPWHRTLTSAAGGVRVETWQVTSADLDVETPVPWSIRKETLRGGRQEGVDLITVDNGRLRFTVIPTRGMGLLAVEMGDVRLGWDSPVREVVHPQFINLHSRSGLGWLEGFNEWMVRCGLEFAGHPGKDVFINNVGDEAEMELTLHGKIANIPASEVEVVVDREPPHRLRVRGRVDERMFHGPKLELWTEISTEPGSRVLRIEDTITNHGAFDQEFQLIYHANYGPPLLEGGARFVGPISRVTPFNAHAAGGVQEYDRYAAPAAGFIEQVYCLYPHADDRNRTVIMLRDAAADRGVSMAFSLDELPYLTLWKNTNAVEEGYVTGLEPGTGFPYNRRVERQFGRVPKLKPAERRRFALDVTILDSAAEVRRTAGEIAGIQRGRPVQIDEAPQVIP
jgi:hypothetical protein